MENWGGCADKGGTWALQAGLGQERHMAVGGSGVSSAVWGGWWQQPRGEVGGLDRGSAGRVGYEGVKVNFRVAIDSPPQSPLVPPQLGKQQLEVYSLLTLALCYLDFQGQT